LLFPKKSGLPLEIHSFESGFKRYLGRAGIEKNYSPHALRNNFAKRCLMNGMDIYTLSRILGHSSVSVTENAYLDLTDRDLRHRYQNYSPIENLRK
jgi:integrase/recombinase XerD